MQKLIKLKLGDLFRHVNSGVICHGCNAKGVMGSGFAKTLRATYPSAYEAYRKAFEYDGLHVGQSILVQVDTHLWVANLITQESYGRKKMQYVSYDGVEACFLSLEKQLNEVESKYNIPTPLELSFPKIGADLGGGDWNKIVPRIMKAVPERGKTLYVLPSK